MKLKLLLKLNNNIAYLIILLNETISLISIDL